MANQPNVQQVVPFLNVTDMEASVRFYVDGLGFTMTRKWVDAGKLRWCWLELGGASMMLQGYRTEGHGGRKPEGKLGLGVTLAFICADALQLYREFTGRAIAAERPMVGNAMWNFAVYDPDGYRLEFESDTDVPEGTAYEPS
jgi:lactoylglutathione lyase